VHECGEGGEYESLVLDAPIFKRRLVLDDTKVGEAARLLIRMERQFEFWLTMNLLIPSASSSSDIPVLVHHTI